MSIWKGDVFKWQDFVGCSYEDNVNVLGKPVADIMEEIKVELAIIQDTQKEMSKAAFNISKVDTKNKTNSFTTEEE